MKTSIAVQVGQNIRRLRNKRGITQEKLAESARTSYKYIQRIESKNPPDIRVSTVQKIAKVLQTTPSRLLEF